MSLCTKRDPYHYHFDTPPYGVFVIETPYFPTMLLRFIDGHFEVTDYESEIIPIENEQDASDTDC